MRLRRLPAILLAVLGSFSMSVPATAAPDTHLQFRPDVFPTLNRNLVAFYDFDHPVAGNPAQERDQGQSGTAINLINGGARMRVPDGARNSLQAMQINPFVKGNDDWKAGLYGEPGVPSLHAFNGVRELTIMGWVKLTGQNPSHNTGSTDPNAVYGAIGLVGLLSGDSNGHTVRGLLELIEVENVLHVVALGRRVDGGNSQTFAATEDWHTLLPQNEWVFLAATFNFDTGAMALYRNGRPLDGFYVVPGDPWDLTSTPGPHASSPTGPRGIKIAGSFPQNNREGNPCNCRFDNLMFLDRALRPWEVFGQYVFTARQFRDRL
jgi:hypothetical protein